MMSGPLSHNTSVRGRVETVMVSQPNDPHQQAMREWRASTTATIVKAQEDYDRTLLTLSGGSMALSLTFIDSVVPLSMAHGQNALLLAWISWSVSLVATLFSHYFGGMALRRALEQVDSENHTTGRFGGRADNIVGKLNLGAGLLFSLGLGAMIFFVSINLSHTEPMNEQSTPTSAPTATPE